MSKDRKETINLPVEIVENWSRMCEYCSSTIIFWNLENKWPTNIIYDGLTYTLNEIKHYLPTESSFNTELPF